MSNESKIVLSNKQNGTTTEIIDSNSESNVSKKFLLPDESGKLITEENASSIYLTKANAESTYRKLEDSYSKTETDSKLSEKLAVSTYNNDKQTFATKTELSNGLNSKANANATVNLTGNQTIAGVKTFSSVPVCATAPTANNHLVNKGYIDSIGQVPDYSAGLSIPRNKAFTARFNGVVEIYCRAVSGYHWAFCLGNTNNNNKTIMSGGTSGSEEVWDAGQAIIIKGETYYFYADAQVYRAMMYPFKSVRSR